MRIVNYRSNRLSILLAAAMLATTALPGFAQTQQSAPSSQSTPSMNSAPEAAEAHNWTEEQIVTCTARECWALSGKNEESFFDIVKQLAEISASKRGVQLPETKQAGMAAGKWIKSHAIADPDQLLYAIVDQAVRHSAARTAAHTAAKPAAPAQ